MECSSNVHINQEKKKRNKNNCPKIKVGRDNLTLSHSP